MIDRLAEQGSEAEFRRGERNALLPYARTYIVVAGAILLIYSAVNPFFFELAQALRFSQLLMVAVVLLAGYFAATFWPRYSDTPWIDFVALLALGAVVMGENVLLFEQLNGLDPQTYANVAINNVMVSAFAAIVFAGRTRWFLAWLACQAAGLATMVMLLQENAAGRVYAIMSYSTGAIVMAFLNWTLGGLHRTGFRLRRALDAERRHNEELLYNVLPQAAVERIKAGQVVADSFGDASVIFIDVVGFTRLSKAVSPGHLIDLLNGFFGVADRAAAAARVEKVKTIGDAYLAISGGNVPAANGAETAIGFARDVLEGLETVRVSTGLDFQVRIGIHSGPLVGGVIGATRMSYDYWGETMNVASRVQSSAEPGGIAVSESTYLRARGAFAFDPPEMATLKGIGEMAVYRMRMEGSD